MKLIIVTGKSGSGKTFVANKLAESLNCPVLSLDEVSHQTLTLKSVKQFVKDTFNESVFEGDEIDRKKLGAIAFSNPEKLEQLNDVCHQEMLKIIDRKLQDTSAKYFVLDYLLLPQMKYFETAFFKVLVKADNHTRKTRIISRDNITEEYFDSRDNNSIEFNDAHYDYVLENSHNVDLTNLINQIKNAKMPKKS